MDKRYADTVLLLLTVAPEVFASDLFAMKGGDLPPEICSRDYLRAAPG
jgi:hypothetical protein